MGIIRGSELGADWGISFVQRTFRDESVIDFTSAGDARYVTDGVSLTGVEIHRFSPFVTVAGRVQLGLEYGGGVGTLAGEAVATSRPDIGLTRPARLRRPAASAFSRSTRGALARRSMNRSRKSASRSYVNRAQPFLRLDGR